MANQVAVMDLDKPTNIPSYLQAYQSETGKSLMVGGGAVGDRIGLKGSRFRLILNGQEEGIVEESFLDIIIVGASPRVSRIYYAGAFDPEAKEAPTCYSVDGDAPAEDVVHKQSVKCNICPKNQVGSRIAENGQKSKACSYFKRLAAVLPSDLEHVYRVEVKGMGLFGESKPAKGQFSLNDYAKKLNNRGVNPSTMITRMSFDTDSSVPKLLFGPAGPDAWVSQELMPTIADICNGDKVQEILNISMQTVDISGEEPAPAAPAEPAPKAPAVKAGPTIAKTQASASAPAAPAAPVVTSGPKAPSVRRVTGASSPTPVAAPPPTTSTPEDDDLASLIAKLTAEDE